MSPLQRICRRGRLKKWLKPKKKRLDFPGRFCYNICHENFGE